MECVPVINICWMIVHTSRSGMTWCVTESCVIKKGNQLLQCAAGTVLISRPWRCCMGETLKDWCVCVSVGYSLIWQRSPSAWNWAQSHTPSSWHQPPLRQPQYSGKETTVTTKSHRSQAVWVMIVLSCCCWLGITLYCTLHIYLKRNLWLCSCGECCVTESPPTALVCKSNKQQTISDQSSLGVTWCCSVTVDVASGWAGESVHASERVSIFTKTSLCCLGCCAHVGALTSSGSLRCNVPTSSPRRSRFLRSTLALLHTHKHAH